MAHLDTAYKLGGLKAARDFTSWVENAEYDNPTAPPPKMAADVAVSKAMEKMNRCSSHKPKRTTRTPAGGGSQFQALKRKLKKNTRKRK